VELMETPKEGTTSPSWTILSLLLLEVELMETLGAACNYRKPSQGMVVSLLLLEVELMETKNITTSNKSTLPIASIIGSGINGNILVNI